MGIDVRSAGRMLAFVDRHMAEAGAGRLRGAVFWMAEVPSMALPEAQNGRLAQLDPLRIGGRDATRLAPHSWRHWCS
jgi:hypothetical protein